jgi:osmoprotectant transport system permease protein
MNANLSERLAELPDFLSGHLLLSVAAIGVGVAISLPLGVFAARRPALSVWTLNIASVIQTIPGLALLALMVPLLGGTIGYAPAFLALMLYSILPVLRNAIVGLQGVDPAVREAARGVGMTDAQRLWRVELPLALPIIVAGLRTSAVWVVGAATLATPVGATSLGNYIFAGLQTRNWLAVLFGCIFAAGLAIALDQMIRLWEVAARDRRRGLALGVGAGLAAMIAAALVAPSIDWSGEAGPRAARIEKGSGGIAGRPVLIGAKAFTEQYILAELIERRLAAAGAAPERLDNLGSAIVFDALANNEIDVSIDYTGTIWATVMNRDDPVDRYSMFVEIAAYLRERHGVLVLGRLGFENAYGFAMRREQAEALGITSLADLAPHADQLRFGGDPEFFSRAEWINSRDGYGLGAAQTRSMDSTFMYGAVRDGEVDVIGAYTTDGRIAAYDLVVLEDPLGALPPYDTMILLSPDASATPAIADALAPLIGAIDGATMREANRRVDLDRQTAGQVGEWLYGELAQD